MLILMRVNRFSCFVEHRDSIFRKNKSVFKGKSNSQSRIKKTGSKYTCPNGRLTENVFLLILNLTSTLTLNVTLNLTSTLTLNVTLTLILNLTLTWSTKTVFGKTKWRHFSGKRPDTKKSVLKVPVQCFSMQVALNKCFILNPKRKFCADPTCHFEKNAKTAELRRTPIPKKMTSLSREPKARRHFFGDVIFSELECVGVQRFLCFSRKRQDGTVPIFFKV